MVDIQKLKDEAVTTKWEKFSPGDLVNVGFIVRTNDKSRVQAFKGRVIAKSSTSATIRKMSHGVSVERVFQLNSPEVDSITVESYGKVRRAKLYYLRELTGRKARVRQKIVKKKAAAN